jgi:hypothetical protein
LREPSFENANQEEKAERAKTSKIPNEAKETTSSGPRGETTI